VLCEVFGKEAKRGKWVLFSIKLFRHYDESIGLLADVKNHLRDMLLCIKLIFMAYYSADIELFKLNQKRLSGFMKGGVSPSTYRYGLLFKFAIKARDYVPDPFNQELPPLPASSASCSNDLTLPCGC
jgi:hypothetical protein